MLNRNTAIVLLLILLLVGSYQPGPSTSKTTLAVVVYESSETPIAPYAMAARERIEAAGIEYRITDKDVETGDGQTPIELKPAIDAAKDKPLPVLVLQSGVTVQRVVPFPQNADAIVKEVTGAN